VASACMDLSDGFADAAQQIAAASAVGMEIDATNLPIAAGAREWFTSRGENPVTAALTGGDDYELLVAVRPRLRRQLAAVMRQADVPLTRVGVCVATPGVMVDGVAMPGGYGHFRPFDKPRVDPSDVEGR
jgi:thiamine-monophosphate kinase